MAMLEVWTGDITELEVDAIVNAANRRMLGGGGVDGAIHRAAGPGLLEACRAVPERSPGVRCPVGEAVVTPGFGLPCRIVVHTVGPFWRGGNEGEEARLGACYRASLLAAEAHGARSIAFPAIGTGAFRFPPDLAAAIAVASVRETLGETSGIGRVVFCAFDDETHRLLARAIGG